MTGGPVVVGVDGSPFAAAAERWAAELAAELGAEVVAVHALGLLVHTGSATEPSQDHRRDIEARLKSEWTAPLAERGVPYRCVVAEGNPVTALLHSAEQLGARMVVVGSRGTGGFPGLQLGSTSHQLAQHATVPVVVIPAPAGDGGGRR